jgi:MscS family membrane protein
MNVSMTDRWRAICHRLAATCLTTLFVFWPGSAAAQEAEKAAEGPAGGLPPWNDVLDALLEFKFGTIPVWRIVASLLLLGLGFALRRFLLQWMIAPLDKLLDRTETTYDDQLLEAVEHPMRWIVNLVALYFALLVLNLPGALMQVASLVLQTVGTVMVAWMANKLINVLVAILGDYSQNTQSEVDDYLVPVVGRVVRVALIGLVVIVIIQQWGYDVTSLLAGLGLGGLAFALAAKPTLANWFGSIMIFTDRPFVVGDRIEIDAGEGVVEEVGLRSTRIRTREDSLITIPNANIASNDIENLSARRKRRINTTLGLVYSTPIATVETIVERLRGVLDDHADIDASQAIVRFSGFGDSALEVYVDCYANTSKRAEFFRIRQEVYGEFARVVDQEGSSFAFPSRSIYMEQTGKA